MDRERLSEQNMMDDSCEDCKECDGVMPKSDAPVDNPLWEVTKELEAAVQKHPELRIGQILSNSRRYLKNVTLFYILDVDLAKVIHKYYVEQ